MSTTLALKEKWTARGLAATAQEEVTLNCILHDMPWEDEDIHTAVDRALLLVRTARRRASRSGLARDVHSMKLCEEFARDVLCSDLTPVPQHITAETQHEDLPNGMMLVNTGLEVCNV